ncbi:MAG: hypothetical protein C4524_05115 [Candidatus Zixiibacteriota bacterium]|nr:MAG: hypothetical protein C4524_05115 [candidate division Zixibacteria bacterium]
MNMRRILISALMVLLVLAIAQPGFAYKKLKCFTLQPPDQVFPNVKRIAVLNFEGDGGSAATDALVSHLLNDKRGIGDIQGGLFSNAREGCTHQRWATTKVFDVVERNRLEQIMQEQHMEGTGLVNDAQAVTIGGLLGVDAIVSGSVVTTHHDKRSTEERTYTRPKEQGGGSYTVKVNVVIREVTAQVKLRVVSVSTAQILGSKEAARQMSKKKDADEAGELPSPENMLGACIGDACVEVANYLAPHFELVEYEFAKVKAKEFSNKAEDAAKWAEQGQLDKAYLIYYSLYQQDQYNPEILYNLGLLHEAVGNYYKAKEMYEGALMMKSEEKDYQRALGRNEKGLTYATNLASIGVPVEEYTWNTDQKAIDQAMAEKIKVKGKSSERISVYQLADATSPELTKIPGGIELTVLGQDGDWYKVKLPGEKEGYLPKGDVKK